MSRTIRAIGAFAVGGALVAAGSLVATPAFAAEQEISTATQYWEVDDTSGASDEQKSGHYAGVIRGWTEDAFDDAGVLYVSDSCENWTIGEGGDLVGVPSNFVNNPGGKTTLTINWEFSSACGDHEIQADLVFEGNYVGWGYTFVNDGEPLDVSWVVTAHQDEYQIDYPSATSAVIYSDDNVDSDDSSSAWSFASIADESGELDNDGDELSYSVSAPTGLAVIGLIADSSYGTGRAAARDYLLAHAATLDTTFGESLPIFYGTDAPSYAPQTLTVGKAVDGEVDYVYTPFDMEQGDSEVLADYFDPGSRFAIAYELGSEIPGVTVTVTFDEETGLPIVTLSGTPTMAGEFTVPITFFYYDVEDSTDRRYLLS